MSSSVTSRGSDPDRVVDSPRRALSDRQARTVDTLTVAAVAELDAAGYSGLTVRGVARRAGVAPATAYTYFASKEHLIAEVFWRRYQAEIAARAAAPREDTAARRALEVLETFALVVAAETELAAACTVAVLADDPDVKILRARIGTQLARQLHEALGEGADPDTVQVLQLAVAGALIQAGTGHTPYDELPALLATVIDLILGDPR